jgi:bacillithiol synthase
MKYLDYRDLPHQTNLFLDYLYDFEKVEKYYTGNFNSDDDQLSFLKSDKTNHIDRNYLCDVLLGQNYNDKEIKENIELLRKPNTFAIVTGQQLSLFGGPLYTIYKIFSAIKLKDLMTEKFPDYNFVPVFWMEAEDHDFNEANKVKIIDKTNNIFTHEYNPEGHDPEANLGAVGKIMLDGNFNNFVDNILSTLPVTDYHDDLVNLISAYKEGSSMEYSFQAFLSEFLKGTGLIFINPNSKEIKRLLKPVFEKELSEFPKTSELVINISAELENIYHAQVKARPINLFMHHKKGRYPIEPAGEDFSLKGIRQKQTKLEMIELLNTTPEVFSPNVIMRPICQDYILPTFMYVAGPAEIAYFAQIKPVYKYFGMTMPIIYPRASATLIENKINKILTKYNLQLNELSANYEGVLRRVSDEVSSIKIDFEFNKVTNDLDNLFSNLDIITKSIDSTLLNNLQNTQNKVTHLITIYKDKLFEAQKRNNVTAIDQIEKVNTNIFPKGNLQERELGLIYFLNKYSRSITDKIYHDLDVTCFKHQLIEL